MVEIRISTLTILLILFSFGSLYFGAIAHEEDMLRQITSEGKCTEACWTMDIQEIKIIKEH